MNHIRGRCSSPAGNLLGECSRPQFWVGDGIFIYTAHPLFMEVLAQLFEQHFHSPVERVQPLQGELGGSGRSIIRLSNRRQSAIGILYGVREENVAFLEFSRHFRQHGLPVPEIYAEKWSEGAYLEQDLGERNSVRFSLAESQRGCCCRARGRNLSQRAGDSAAFSSRGRPGFELQSLLSTCEFRPAVDYWDLNYFKYYFLRLAGIPFNEQALEQDFTRLTKFLLSADHDYFLYRDFQSRNVMLHDGAPFFVDYQGGRRGALQYDVASLLYDAKADLPPALRQQLLDHYLETLRKYIPITREAFMQHYYAFVYVRLMQAFGAYGFRGFYERKAHFLQSVPYALKNLRWLLHNVTLPIELPTLIESFQRMLGSEKLLNLHFEAPHGPKIPTRVPKRLSQFVFIVFPFIAAARLKMRPEMVAALFSMAAAFRILAAKNDSSALPEKMRR